MNYLVKRFCKKDRSKVILTPSVENFVYKKSRFLRFLKMQFILIFMTKTEQWNSHVELALWDVLLVAPCTANTLAKMVHGF